MCLLAFSLIVFSGTPAKKAKHDSEEPNEQPKEKGSLLKSLLAVNMYQSPAEGSQTTYIPNVAPVLPQTLSQSAVPPGDVQTSLNTKSCIFVINSNLAMPSSSLTDLNSFTNLQNTGSNNSSLINPQTTGQTNYVYILPTTQATESPLKVQPVLRSLQTPVGTNIVYIPNLINASIIPQSNVQVLYNSIPTTLLKETDVSTLSDMKSVINSFSSSVDENNNLQSLDCSRPAILETDDDFDHSKCSDLDFPCQPDLGFGSDEDYDGADELSPTGSRGNKNVIDKDMVSDEDIVPFPQIWHYFQGTVKCLSIGTPKNNKIFICSKCKIDFKCPTLWAHDRLIIMCSNIGAPKTINFPFGTNGKLMVLGVLIL